MLRFVVFRYKKSSNRQYRWQLDGKVLYKLFSVSITKNVLYTKNYFFRVLSINEIIVESI
ncbi:hypothetical protein J2W97_002594 [Paenibacillus jamilae]|jgi:hypothetical protein|nr:hypothetical protein [Paenibacillus jamilae]